MRPTQALMRSRRRLALTTKQTNKGYYKGTRTGSMGTHTKYGGYVIDWKKVRTYVVPATLRNFELTPFVSKMIRPQPGQFDGDPKGPFSGEVYLAKWKAESAIGGD